MVGINEEDEYIFGKFSLFEIMESFDEQVLDSVHLLCGVRKPLFPQGHGELFFRIPVDDQTRRSPHSSGLPSYMVRGGYADEISLFCPWEPED